MCQIRDPDKFWTKIRRQFQQRRASKDPLPEQESLSHIRKRRRIPQSTVAATLGVRQSDISRLERRRDLKVSTLAAYAAALGGELDLVVRFPGLLIRIRLGHP